jgi:hypothetical protein
MSLYERIGRVLYGLGILVEAFIVLLIKTLARGFNHLFLRHKKVRS